MTKELEPCPFCPDGGKPKRMFMTYFKENGYWVECEECHSTSGQRRSREEADDAWNTRYKRTCIYTPDYVTSDDEGYEEAHVDYWYCTCSECGNELIGSNGGEYEGWFIEEPGKLDEGLILIPKFKHCPECGLAVLPFIGAEVVDGD